MTIQVPTYVLEALTRWVNSVSHEAYARGLPAGYQKGYQKGWSDATSAMMEAVAAKRVAPHQSNNQPAVTEIEAEIATPKPEAPSEWTSRNYIEAALTAKPGMRPVEVARWVVEKYPKVNEQMILQQIKRMRKQDAFVARDDSALYLVKSKEAA